MGFGAECWTSHGLRRGGATHLLLNGWSIENIMQFGRWLSPRSCREYLRKAEALSLSIGEKFPAAAWQTVARMVAYEEVAWKTCDG